MISNELKVSSLMDGSVLIDHHRPPIFDGTSPAILYGGLLIWMYDYTGWYDHLWITMGDIQLRVHS